MAEQRRWQGGRRLSFISRGGSLSLSLPWTSPFKLSLSLSDFVLILVHEVGRNLNRLPSPKPPSFCRP
ncbi:hypothetical protein F2Q70_00003896 [Brassica cretica]|uniref:Uncharacterized protein n=1 Tax=Brassica cretica TaxID=69181 RepID=A0A8S9INB4_BRACR|nr:hypothetical protein F2Q70_00003896 [Brassica cretica]